MTMTDEIANEAAAWLREALPNAAELERFETGDALPVAGVITYRGGPEKGVKAQCYLSSAEREVVVLKPKKVTKSGGGVEVGAVVLKVAAHVLVGRVLSFVPASTTALKFTGTYETSTMTDQVEPTGTVAPIEPLGMVNLGYTFNGWSLTSNDTGPLLQSGQSWNFSKGATLYAVWAYAG